MATDGAARSENSNVDLKIQYFEKQVIPWMLAHISTRSIGLQVFVATQGGLLIAWATSGHWAFTILGLASCLSCSLWDARNRSVFERCHKLGEEIVDRVVFGTGSDGMAIEGLHRQAVRTIDESGRLIPKLGKGSGFFSHTWAIRVMIFAATSVWIVLIVNALC